MERGVKTEEESKVIGDKRILFLYLVYQGKKIAELRGENSKNCFFVYNVHVHPEHRGRGIGTFLFHEIFRKYGKPIAVLFPYPWVLPFYKKLGFKRIPKSLVSFKRLTKKEKRIAKELKKRYSFYLKKRPDAVMFAKPLKHMCSTRRLLKR